MLIKGVFMGANRIGVSRQRAHDSLNGTMHLLGLGIVIGYGPVRALSNHYPLSDCLGIVTSVQSSLKASRALVR